MSSGEHRSALADTVYETVKAQLMDGEIVPGGRVSIDGLARSLQVSPTPVREALVRLESDGLVVKRAGSGYRASDILDDAGLNDLFAMRLLLEPRAAALASENADEADLGELERLHDEMSDDRELGDHYSAYRRFMALDQEFHDTIAGASGSPLLADAISRLHSHLYLFRRVPARGGATSTQREHRAILDALDGRDPDRAAEAMARHVRASRIRHRR